MSKAKYKKARSTINWLLSDLMDEELPNSSDHAGVGEELSRLSSEVQKEVKKS